MIDEVKSGMRLSDEFVDGFQTFLSVVDEDTRMKNNFSEVRFFFDDFGVRESESIGESPSSDIKCVLKNIAFQSDFTHIFDERKGVGFDTVQVQFDNVLENKLMFGTIEIVSVDDVEKFWNDFAATNEHCAQNFLFHFEVVGEIIGGKKVVHKNAPLSKIKGRHSVNVAHKYIEKATKLVYNLRN